MKIGDYEPHVQEEGSDESTIGTKEGEVYWTVQMEKDGQLDVDTQIEAIIISKLVLIEKRLKKVEKKLTANKTKE